VDRKLLNIKECVESTAELFRRYLFCPENKSLVLLLTRLSELSKVYIFSGVIRNFFLDIKVNRDIDIVIEGSINVDAVFKGADVRKNSFGGYKIIFEGISIDLWYLENTWAIKREGILLDLETKVPETAFFNFSAIVYSLHHQRFFVTKDFARFIWKEEIDVVYKPNPNDKLCVVNTFYYSEKYKLNIAKGLKLYLRELYEQHDKDYSAIQIKHFGKVIFTNEQIEHRVETILNKRKRYKKKMLMQRWCSYP
jgi:hypothetical protein